MVIALQREAARPGLAGRLRDGNQAPWVAGEQIQGTQRHVLAAARQQAGDTVFHHFGNASRRERDDRNAGGESLQDDARGGFVRRRGHQQQIELRHAGGEIVHPAGELVGQARSVAAQLRQLALGGVVGEERRPVDREAAFR